MQLKNKLKQKGWGHDSSGGVLAYQERSLNSNLSSAKKKSKRKKRHNFRREPSAF
jgi:hypothetical protein